MTLIVGVRCSDGIVMGADTAATYMNAAGYPTIRNESAKKLQIIDDKMIFSLTGSTGMAGRILPVLHEIWECKATEPPLVGGKKYPVQKKLNEVTCADAAEYIRAVLWARVYAPEVQQAAGAAHKAGFITSAREAESAFLLAIPGKKREEFSLLSFNPVGSPDEVSDALFCCNIGSGQPIADPFMGFLRRVLWDNKPPTVRQAVLGVWWCLKHAIELHPGGVGGQPQIATLEFNSAKGWVARMLPESVEHNENIKDIEGKMKDWADGRLDSDKDSAVPNAPPGPETK